MEPITLLNTGLGELSDRPFQACRRALRTNTRPLLLNLASFFLFLEPEQQVQPVLAKQRDLCLSALNPEPEGSPCRWGVLARGLWGGQITNYLEANSQIHQGGTRALAGRGDCQHLINVRYPIG